MALALGFHCLQYELLLPACSMNCCLLLKLMMQGSSMPFGLVPTGTADFP